MLNYMDLINNENREVETISEVMGIDLNIERIRWVAGLCNVSKAEEIMNHYLTECYGINLTALSGVLESAKTKEIILEE